MDKDRSRGLFSLEVRDSLWLPRNHLSDNISIEEIEDEIEDETEVEMTDIEEDIEEYCYTPSRKRNESEKSKKSYGLQEEEEEKEENRQASAALEEDLEMIKYEDKSGGLFSLEIQDSSCLPRKPSSENIPIEEEIQAHSIEVEEEVEKYSYTPFSETNESDNSENSGGLQEDEEEEERQASAALEEELEMMKRDQVQQKEALEQEQKEKDALSKALKEEQDEKASLHVELEHMKTQVADLKSSRKEHRHRNSKLQHKISKMTADHEEDKLVIEKLKNDLEVSSHQHKKEIRKRDKANCANIKALGDQLIEQQKESLEKDNEIQCLRFNIQNLQSGLEAKDNTVFSLQVKLDQWASDLKEEQMKNCKLQAAVSRQQKEAEELDRLTRENQQLASKNKRLQGELEDALNEVQFVQKQLQEDREACSRLEEAVKKEKSCFLRAHEMIKKQETELFEMTVALEKSKTRLKKASASLEGKKYDMQTLKMENADIRTKFMAMETKYDIIVSKHQSLRESHEEMRKNQKNDNQATIARLEYMVDDFKARQSEAKTRQAELEDALKQEKTHNSNLLQRSNEMASSLVEERTACEKYCVKFEEALNKQIETLGERQELAVTLQKTQDSLSTLQRQQLEESNFHKNKISENRATIAQLQYMVDDLKAHQSESKTRQAELEDALKQEKTRSSDLQQRADQGASTLEKVKTMCEKYRVELKEALIKQTELLEERQKLAVALQKTQDSLSRLHEQQLAESNFQSRHINDTELRLSEKKVALDEALQALHSLQTEHTDLGKKYCASNHNFCELLKTHSALQIRYERLGYAQGNPQPEINIPQFTFNL